MGGSFPGHDSLRGSSEDGEVAIGFEDSKRCSREQMDFKEMWRARWLAVVRIAAGFIVRAGQQRVVKRFDRVDHFVPMEYRNLYVVGIKRNRSWQNSPSEENPC
jgi:hypothetical protein